MRFTIVQFRAFAAQWAAEKLTDDNLRALELQLMQSPGGGPVMAGTGGVRKTRFAPRSRRAGKGGAFRVCYAWFPRHATLVLAAMFAKNVQGNLSKGERNMLAGLVKQYGETLPKGDH